MIPYFIVDHFSLGPFKFYTWGFFIALAFSVGIILSLRSAKKIGVSSNKIIWLVVFVYIGAIIGGRLFFILQSPLDFLRQPLEIFHVSSGGMMFYGGLVGGTAAGWIYLRKIEKRRQLVYALIPIIPLAMAIGRIGCFLNNDHQGAITGVPWAILWPDGTLRHPVALYLILFDLALAGGLWWFSRSHSESRVAGRGISRPRYAEGFGEASECGTKSSTDAGDSSGGFFAKSEKSAFRMANSFLLFLFLYPLGRFFLDFTRDASADPHFFGLAVSQWISLALLTIVLAWYMIKHHRLRKEF